MLGRVPTLGSSRSWWIALAAGLTALLAAIAASPDASEATAPPAENGKIAFDRCDPSQCDIWIMNPDGSGQVNLTNTALSEGKAAFSPDGRKIAFERCADPMCAGRDIYVMNADGSQQVNLTNAPGMTQGDPAFSPDGRKIAFARGQGELFIMNTDGSNQRRLDFTGNLGVDQSGGPSPSFSPDGRRITFARGDGEQIDIYVIKVDGTGLVNLGTDMPGDSNELTPSFSPDGRRIVFGGVVFPSALSSIFVARVDGSGEEELVSAAAPEFAGDPVFSPDGRRIAFGLHNGTQSDVFVMNADGSAQDNRTATAGSDESSADWQPIQRCGGKRATIVGDDGKDKIKGTKKRDVIDANAGKDSVDGGGGNDLICGGKGKDNLKGAKGKDTLRGGKKRDALKGGKGRDRCIGGKGRDTGAGCESGRL